MQDREQAMMDHLRGEVTRYREAALLAYGALAARSAEYPSDDIISTLNKYLFPTLSAPDAPNSK